MKRSKKGMLAVAALYGLASLVVAAGSALCHQQVQENWAEAFSGMFVCLFPGGFGMSLLLAYVLPPPGQSEYYWIFQGLYHGGILLLTVTAIFDGVVKSRGLASTDVRLTAIAGWALLMAGLIVLFLILGNRPGKNKSHTKSFRERSK